MIRVADSRISGRERYLQNTNHPIPNLPDNEFVFLIVSNLTNGVKGFVKSATWRVSETGVKTVWTPGAWWKVHWWKVYCWEVYCWKV